MSKPPVYDVLTSVLETMSPDGIAEGELDSDKPTAVFSYRRDKHFDALWEMAASLPSCFEEADDKERTLIVNWDGMPSSNEGTINVADYVTPFDWALALSWSIVKNKVGDGEDLSETEEVLPNLRILILDLKSQDHPGSLGVRTFKVAGRALPWVHTYRPIGRKMGYQEAALSEDPFELAALRSALPVGTFGIDHMIEDLIDTERLLKLGDERGTSTRGDMEMLVDLWKSNLTRAGDRHHVGNLLSPLLLAEGLPSSLRDVALERIEEDDPLRSALRKLVGALGLVEPKVEGENLGHAGKGIGGGRGLLDVLAEEPDFFDRKHDICFGLVDDQYELGFDHVLDHLLRGNTQSPGGLRCRADANGLFEALRDQPEVEDWSLPRHLDLGYDVLLLDLRLWTRQDERQAFFSEALSVCEALDTEELKERDASFKRAFEAAERLVSSDGEDGDQEASEVEALAFLPLLLSHYDPSLPIILFSSTQQRAVLEMTEHRPNILTGFSKPILSGYGEGRSAAASLSDFIKEVREAVYLHEARCVWERLPSCEWTNRPTVKVSSTKYNGDGDPVLNPRLQGDELRSQLAEYYIHYLLGGRHFDFASIPYEIIEGNLTPSYALQEYGKTSFRLLTDDPKNYLGIILRDVRHKKAHSYLRISKPKIDSENYKSVSIFLFMLFLDYIEAEQEGNVDFLDQKSEWSKHDLKNKVWHTIRNYSDSLLSYKKPKYPKNIISIPGITYLHFVGYSSVYNLSQYDGHTGISATTNEALGKILTQGFENSALFIWLGSKNMPEEKIAGIFDPAPKRVDVYTSTDCKGGPKTDEDGSRSFFSVVLFDTHEDAEDALRVSGGEAELDGQTFSIEWNDP